MSKNLANQRAQELLGFRIPMLASIRAATSAKRNERLFGLKNLEGRTLFVLGSNPALSLKQLVRVSGIETAYASRTIAALVAAGYVTKAVDKSDRRSVRLTLTAQGAKLYQALLKDTIEREAEWSSVLTEADYLTLIDALDRLTERARVLADAERLDHQTVPQTAARFPDTCD